MLKSFIVCALFFLPAAFAAPKVKTPSPARTVHDTVRGDVGADRKEGVDKWIAKCQTWLRDTQKQNPDVEFIVCGNPVCQDAARSSVCTSDAQYRLRAVTLKRKQG